MCLDVVFFCMFFFFCFKQKTAYEMRISDWSSDVCSSDLRFLIGYNKRKDAAHNDIRWLAWHIEALNRQKRLPSFNEMMGVAPKAMDEDEIEKMLDQIGRASCRERVCQ